MDEPEKDKSLRGSRDGFVETVVFDSSTDSKNTCAIPQLVMEMLEVGGSSRSDVVLCSYEAAGRCKAAYECSKEDPRGKDGGSLRESRQSLGGSTHGNAMGYNPFPKSEISRNVPGDGGLSDGAKGGGSMRDNSPSALTLPTSVFDMIEESGNDYYFPAWTSLYLKFSESR